jgi:hypothetical protein
MMMTQELGASLLSAPLAAIDRRALSQAWYSALHLAGAAAVADAPPPRFAVVPERAPRPVTHLADARSQRLRDARPVALADARAKRGASGEIAFERRAPRSGLARRIERSLLDPRSRAKRATFSIDSGRARVVVVLQTRGRQARLVALCAPSIRATVARALAQARYALAQRGIALEVAAEGKPCS